MKSQRNEQGRIGGVSGAPLFDGPCGVVQAASDPESWVPERFAGVDQLAPSASTVSSHERGLSAELSS